MQPPDRYRTRPSVLLTAAKAAGVGAGALAAAAPAPLRNALVGGLQDALTEVYNEQLGELRQQGLSDEAPEVRVLRVWVDWAVGITVGWCKQQREQSFGAAGLASRLPALSTHCTDPVSPPPRLQTQTQVRLLLLGLRDLERAPEGAPTPPDVLALQRATSFSDVGVQGLVGAAAKAVALALLGASKKF